MVFKKLSNPFYVLLVMTGVVFTVTACAYGVMTVRGLRPELATDESGAGLLTFLDQHGAALLLSEIGVLAVLAAAAMAVDACWSPNDRVDHGAVSVSREPSATQESTTP